MSDTYLSLMYLRPRVAAHAVYIYRSGARTSISAYHFKAGRARPGWYLGKCGVNYSDDADDSPSHNNKHGWLQGHVEVGPSKSQLRTGVFPYCGVVSSSENQ